MKRQGSAGIFSSPKTFTRIPAARTPSAATCRPQMYMRSTLFVRSVHGIPNTHAGIPSAINTNTILKAANILCYSPFSALSCNRMRQLGIDIAKSAVRKNGDYITRQQPGRKARHDRVRIGVKLCRDPDLRQACNDALRLQTLRRRNRFALEDTRQRHLICSGETVDQIRFEDIATQSIRARFEHGD